MTDLSNMIEVHLKVEDDFLKVKETLTRIGVASRKDRKLYQSCHILHKQGRYFIVHFKELFALDGKPSDFNENESDIGRRNAIANLLEQWDLVTLVDSGTSKRNMIINASENYFQSQIDRHKINVENILDNSVGVAEHSDIMTTIEKELEQMAHYQDLLDMIKHFND